MFPDFYIPRLSNDMKIAVKKNHLGLKTELRYSKTESVNYRIYKILESCSLENKYFIHLIVRFNNWRPKIQMFSILLSNNQFLQFNFHLKISFVDPKIYKSVL